MTRITFYRYASDKLGFACRLAAKAYGKDSRLVVYAADKQRLARFDQMLWTLQATSFVPHCAVEAALAAETPILRATAGAALPHHAVLMHRDDEWPPFFATFDRLLEIVGQEEDDKERARGRYVFYKKRGYDIEVHDVEGEKKDA